MTLVVSVQTIDERGVIGPLPGEPDVVEGTFDSEEQACAWLADELREHPRVDCFDLTITRRTP